MILEGLKEHEVAQLIPIRPILVAYRGSISHGTHIPPEDSGGIDDVDIVVAYIPELAHYFGFPQPATGRDIKIGKWDCAAYEVRHVVQLLANGNPNVTALLWTKPEHIIHKDYEGQMLIEHRDLFISKKLAHSFGGYAYGQLKRAINWNDPVPTCGCTGEFHTSECAVSAERGRGSSKRFATGFMGAKRKALCEKFGYDAKNAAHLIRLLRMGIEIMRGGMVYVDRTAIDAHELKDIKTGKWSLDRVKQEAEHLFAALELARDQSALPYSPDERKIENLLVDIMCYAKQSEITLRRSKIISEIIMAVGPI